MEGGPGRTIQAAFQITNQGQGKTWPIITKNMSMKDIRKSYGVPAFRGVKTAHKGGWEGKIVSSKEYYVGVKLENEKRVKYFHPSSLDYIVSSMSTKMVITQLRELNERVDIK